MSEIVFFDTEVTVERGRIVDFGALNEKGEKLHTERVDLFLTFIKETSFLCGHNIIKHDLVYLERHDKSVMAIPAIDTLALSPLLFPKKPYHRLVKDDKLHTEQLNNPLNDAIQAKDLFYDECSAYEKLDETMKKIFRGLLWNQDYFRGFFQYIEATKKQTFLGLFGSKKPAMPIPSFELSTLIKESFRNAVCDHAPIEQLVDEKPVELAYCLAMLHADDESRYRWNSVNADWINSKNDLEEIGCIHTVQGYDLNYAGVIIGPELIMKNGKIEFVSGNYKDSYGKHKSKSKDEMLKYITNIYKTLMTRGIIGTYVYVCDDALREYFGRFVERSAIRK